MLLHGIGMSHHAWAPVLPLLSRERRVLAFDLPGFGSTPPLDVTPTMEHMAEDLQRSLQALGLHEPVDLVGNSLGGLLALTMASQGHARTVTALSPGGLWTGRDAPAAVRATLRVTHWAVTHLPGTARKLADSALGRTLLFAVPVTSTGWRIPAQEARNVIQTHARATAFEPTFQAATSFTSGADIRCPVTVAFGTRDWLLTRQRCEALPAQTRWLRPRGWGHVPMWDDPPAVARLILDASA